MAHHIAAWLGIPIGIVIAAMVILRKRGMELRAPPPAGPRDQPVGAAAAARRCMS